jgi:hypothetical protein
MVTNVAMFYEKWKVNKGSQTHTLVYTPLNITTSVILTIITIMLLVLLNQLTVKQRHNSVNDQEENADHLSDKSSLSTLQVEDVDEE